MEVSLTQFLSYYRWLTDSYVIEFFTENHWNRVPSKWRDVLDKTSLAKISEARTLTIRSLFSSQNSFAAVYPLSLLAFVACTRYLAHQRHPQPPGDIFAAIPSDRDVANGDGFTIGAQVQGMDHAFRHCIKPKKQHEIKVLGEAVYRLSEVTGCKNVIDIGAGQGHLARYLAFRYGLNVVTMEAVGCHIAAATKLDSYAENALERKKQTCGTCDGGLKENRGSLRHIVAMVDPSISPEDLLGYVTNGHTYPTEKYLLVGLHTCGDLAPTILRLFSQSQCIVGVVSVGCCYMKLTCQPCELSNVPTSSSCDCHMTTTCAVVGRGSPECTAMAVDCSMTTPHGYPMTTPHGYPMSRGVMSLPSHSLSYEAREMACHALEAYAERLGDAPENIHVHCHRALVEILLRKRGITRGQLRMPRSVSRLPFADYAKAVLQSAGVSFTIEEIESLVPMLTEWWERVAIFFVLRLLLAPCVETLVLMDRVLYLQEQGHSARLTPLFEPKVSPRNLVLIAYKN